MDEFLKKVAEAIKSAGFDAKYDGMYLVVAGCKFDAEGSRPCNKNPGCKVVTFMDSSFLVKKNGTFDLARAVGLVIAALPGKLKEKEAWAAVLKNRELRQQFTNKQPARDDWRYSQSWYPVKDNIALSECAEGVYVRILCTTEEQIRGLVG